MSVVEQILDVEIILDDSIKGISPSEMSKLVESHWLIQQARDDFLNGLLTWSEYLELCEMHNMNIDGYLETVNENLEAIGIIV